MNVKRKSLPFLFSTVAVLILLSAQHWAIAGENPMGPAETITGKTGDETWLDKGENKASYPLIPAGSSSIVHNVPTLSKEMSVGGTSFSPYVGAGFGSGYASELDRSLNAPPPSSLPSDSGFRSLFGQSLVPNEVQIGVRLPF